MTNPVGRPRLPPGQKKIQIAAKVRQETADYLSTERTKTGKSLGVLIEEAVQSYQDSTRKKHGEIQ